MTAPAIPSYDTQDWQKSCRARGGVPTRDPKSGADACRLPDAVTGAAPWRYEPAQKSLSDLVAGWLDSESTAWDKATGAIAVTVDDSAQSLGIDMNNGLAGLIGSSVNAAEKAATKAVDGTGLNTLASKGLFGITADVLGVPGWLFVVIVLVALYAAGRSIGVFPSIGKLVG